MNPQQDINFQDKRSVKDKILEILGCQKGSEELDHFIANQQSVLFKNSYLDVMKTVI